MSLLVEFPLESETRYGQEIKTADNSYLGVWINGSGGEMVNWLLTKGAVPCFLVSAPPHGVLLKLPQLGFTEGTDVEALISPSYVYDQLARNQELTFTAEERDELIADSHERRDVDLVAANLHWQLQLPWAYPLFSRDGQVVSVDSAIHALRVPSIASNAVSKGVWEVYAEDSLKYDEPDLGPVMRLKPKKGKGRTDREDGGELWYDRPPNGNSYSPTCHLFRLGVLLWTKNSDDLFRRGPLVLEPTTSG
ncbi:hypothetical protein K438DRAFT_1996639 [Mycena galopus ATCC 62051]|nr:hypothetical protein K438DRAFT_1996639 [Mycena galopus ATCC 62051]